MEFKNRIKMNLPNRKRITDFENKLMVTKGNRWYGGRNWEFGLAHAHCGVRNDWPTGNCYIAQGTLPKIL